MINWFISHQADRRACRLADRHYSRKTRGAPQFVPPGRSVVLLNFEATALWVSNWQREEYAPYPGWICTLFRNESDALSSDLIREAIAATRWKWGEPPPHGMLTFIDSRKIRSSNPGYCFKKAGFQRVGVTRSGLMILQLLPEAMPAPEAPNGAQLRLFECEVQP